MRLAVKPYPSCRYSHAAIDGILALMQQHGFAADDVEEVEIGLPETGWKIIGTPADAKAAPKSVVDGQFSMPFIAAVALRERGLAWDDYKKHLHDGATLALCRKVRTVVDARAQAEFPANMSGAARIKTTAGAFETFVAVPKGEPGNFLIDAEFRRKFDGLCAPYLGAGKAQRLADTLLALEHANGMQAVMALSQADGEAL
jgi:2-methylcitrate dehydratase PrpD